mmetsp:Transcript_110593/g.356994  ORF Transcript_110593/g.356994 Transcript_110593/m.356994 type:complete len:247 (+) Transcript_110593:85-825(+)
MLVPGWAAGGCANTARNLCWSCRCNTAKGGESSPPHCACQQNRERGWAASLARECTRDGHTSLHLPRSWPAPTRAGAALHHGCQRRCLGWPKRGTASRCRRRRTIQWRRCVRSRPPRLQATAVRGTCLCQGPSCEASGPVRPAPAACRRRHPLQGTRLAAATPPPLACPGAAAAPQRGAARRQHGGTRRSLRAPALQRACPGPRRPLPSAPVGRPQAACRTAAALRAAQPEAAGHLGTARCRRRWR